MSEQLKQAVKSILQPLQPVYLATSMENQPRVRPVTLIYHEGRFYIATGSWDAKVKQIAANPKVETCLMIKEDPYSGYARACGELHTVSDEAIRREIFEAAPFLSNYWNEPTDPGYVLYQMSWEEVEYMKPGESVATKFNW